MKSSQNEEWVTASAAGRAAFCEKYLELQRDGAPVSRSAQQARNRGTEAHNQFNERISHKSEDKRCFVATHLYGCEDPRTELLRQFRDTRLMRTRLGRIMVHIYYASSPWLVRLCQHSPRTDQLVRRMIDKIVCTLLKHHSS